MTFLSFIIFVILLIYKFVVFMTLIRNYSISKLNKDREITWNLSFRQIRQFSDHQILQNEAHLYYQIQKNANARFHNQNCQYLSQ